MYPPIGLSVGPSNRPLYSRRKYVTASGPNAGGAKLRKVLVGLKIVLPPPGYAMGEVIRRGFIRISALDVTL
ncbi:hypothetical protein N7471_004245 [Penicillium samsonianum]|uniref:uncharacterized protein n=1 Tax=Penicillium samsonianum TaxID=1882272 RepID=UPI002546A521|nr:uncharacterized protein N7471_004245 [Penicillium samsonianum]KAJ6137759.1 hypothetical protein N7471_004245 [Penicillium samsonianum]